MEQNTRLKVAARRSEGDRWDEIQAHGELAPLPPIALTYRPVTTSARRTWDWAAHRARRTANPTSLLALGSIFGLIPLLFPVWERTWVEQASPVGQFSNDYFGLLSRNGFLSPRKMADERRAFLFSGPDAPAPWPGTCLNRFPVLTSPSEFRTQPQYGRMVLEAMVLAIPFLVAALVMRRSTAQTPSVVRSGELD